MLGFPRGDIVEVPIALREHGISLRTSTAADMAFLRRLYGQVRADELAVLPWLASQKEAFLDSQFALQHQHYLSHFPDACFLLVECNATPIGRFYLLKQAPEFLIIDISVAIAWQNQGIGTALMRDAQTMAQKVGAGCVCTLTSVIMVRVDYMTVLALLRHTPMGHISVCVG